MIRRPARSGFSARPWPFSFRRHSVRPGALLMTTALFYANPRPLQTDADAELRLRTLTNFEFARNVNSIPINMIEFPLAARHYPITFVGPEATPMAIVGLQTENLFLDAEGHWKEGYYIPAFVRRYPFIFAKGEATNEYSLCVDDVPDVVGA